MKKSRRRSSRVVRRGFKASKNSRAVDLAAVRQKIINLVGNNACDMVVTAMQEFEKTGSINALKHLFEMIGLFPCPAGEQGGADDSALTRTLLQRLGDSGENVEDTKVTSEPEVEFVRLGADTVE